MTDLDFHYLCSIPGLLVNYEPFDGSLVVDDIITINQIDYTILSLNEDGIVTKEIK